ncbi:response regulator [Dyadobacter psychrotolerans]|uniref:Sensory/regulatory protein RpfC n=1 Tax=Dyadobacter psychrotolerans TaxID=2541721 RepID=A0A4R5DU73_9BACT|nr:response regulator [Dyadobacter psychrotolerans]TDE14473.1 response regulator [Dyadobacter psychrotolerans]
MKNPSISDKEIIRLAALHAHAMPDTETEAEFDRIASLAALICDAPISMISFIDKDRKWVKSGSEVLMKEVERFNDICQFTLLTNELTEIQDLLLDEMFKDSLFVTESPFTRFYAGYPLVDMDGNALGNICVLDSKVRTLTKSQRESMKMLADQVMTLLAGQRKREEFRNFEKLFKLSSDLVCIAGTDGFFKKLNPAFEDLLGWEEDFLMQTSFLEFIHPEDRESTRTEIARLSAGNPVAKFTQRFRCKNGFYLTLQWLSTPDPVTGDLFSIGRNITESYQLEKDLLRAQEMLLQTNELARVGGWEMDVVKNQLYWTEVTKQIHQVHPDFVPNFQNWSRFFKDETSLQNLINVIRVATETGDGFTAELELTTDGGEKVWVRSIGKAEFEHGACKRLLGTFQDITNEIAHREELIQAKRLSEQASVAKTEFLANMSHEIRTPLNGIIGFTDLILKMQMDETQKQYLTIVNQSASTLLDIVNDVLDFAKIEAGKLELEINRCDINEIIARAADVIAFPVQSKGLEMLVNIPSGLPRFVWVDETRLKQILINLLSNASKFTRSGEIELKVLILAYEPETSDEMTCRFIVHDTGIGIKKEKEGDILEAFVQEDGSTTKRYGGAGLGLAIANKLLGMMGSRLQLASVYGVESTFFFDLTMKSEQGEPVVWQSIDSLNKVLIVDDNDNNRTILEGMLQLLQISSDQVKSGREALDCLASGYQYDAVLMDYNMPEMDGLETIRQIRKIYCEDPHQLPIVLLTSSADDATVIKACDELMVSHRLMKPLKLHDIFLCLSRLSLKDDVTSQITEVAAMDMHADVLLHVLIAEDNPVNMFLTKTIISKVAPNTKIYEARNGVEAVEFCKRQKPDLIFMDIQMPEMNGYEATAAIRALPKGKQISIVALTAGNVKGEREKCVAVGMDDFITKPFLPADIKQVFNQYPDFTVSVLAKKTFKAKLPFESHFSAEKLRNTYMHDQEFIREFLFLTREALGKGLADLNKCHKLKDFKGIQTAGHKLKGAASSAFLFGVTNIAASLEHLDSFENAAVGVLLADLEKEIELMLPILIQTENGG